MTPLFSFIVVAADASFRHWRVYEATYPLTLTIYSEQLTNPVLPKLVEAFESRATS